MESLASGKQINKNKHMTRHEGNEHCDIISTRFTGPDASKLTTLSKPQPSLVSSDDFISKNFTIT